MLPRKTVTLKFWNKTLAHCRRRALFPDGASLLLAVSGGPDSVAMLDFFAGQARRRRLKLTVCHVNHKLRGAASDADAAFVRKLGGKYGLKTLVYSADVKRLAAGAKTGVEHAARAARYRLLSAAALEQRCGYVATAHHADDHAETVLLNLLRGTEPKGLLGIPASRELCRKGRAKVMLVRPLLGVTRAEIEAYLAANCLPSRKDRTNDDEQFRRNWIRRTLLPLLEKKQPRLREHLAELSSKLAKVI